MVRKSEIRAWILDYGLHDARERERVCEYVQRNPEWDTCYRTALQWERLLSDARSLANPDLDNEVLPYAVATDRLPENARNKPLRTVLDRIFRRAGVKSDLQLSLVLYRTRKEAVDSITDAVSHFEAVTGHSVRGEDRGEQARSRRRSRNAFRSIAAVSRAPVARSVLRPACTLVVMYIFLFFASTYRDTPIERMAHLRAGDFSWTELGVSARGDDTEWGRLLIARYDEALYVAASSQKTFLGLFPTYRYDQLQRARNLLQDTIQLQSERESVPAAAFITLAKLHFLLGDTTESLNALREVVTLSQARSAIPNNLMDESEEANQATRDVSR